MEILSDVLAKIEAEIKAAGLMLFVHGDELVVRTGWPGATLTPQVKSLLAAHKAELLALSKQRQLLKGIKAVLADALAKEADIAKSYETKATVAGDVPPYQRVLAQQEWLSTIDWSKGLKCGRTGRQCRVCKGMPCGDSSEW